MPDGSRSVSTVGLVAESITCTTSSDPPRSPRRTCNDMTDTGVKSPVGVDHPTEIWPRVTYWATGAPGVEGATSGTITAEGADGPDSPTALVAVTTKTYACPGVRPPITQVLSDPA